MLKAYFNVLHMSMKFQGAPTGSESDPKNIGREGECPRPAGNAPGSELEVEAAPYDLSLGCPGVANPKRRKRRNRFCGQDFRAEIVEQILEPRGEVALDSILRSRAGAPAAPGFVGECGIALSPDGCEIGGSEVGDVAIGEAAGSVQEQL